MKISLLSFARKGGLSIFVSTFFLHPLQATNETCHFLLKQAVNSPAKLSQLKVSPQKCPLIADLIFWIRLQKDPKSASFEQIAHFIERHPDWPYLKSPQGAGEKQLTPEISPKRLCTFFAKYPPQTFQGRVYFIQALLRTGQKEKAQELIRQTWKETTLTVEEQHHFLARFSEMLTRKDHENRLNFMLWGKNIEQAAPMLPRVSEPLQREARVWMAFLQNDPAAITQYAALPVAMQNHEGLYLASIAYLKKAKEFDKAIKQLLAFEGPITQPTTWWQERSYLAREMVQINNYALAYQLIQNHHLTTTSEIAEAEWFAGWLCVSFLKNPEQAKQHFYRFRDIVKTPISLARAGYWLGRTYEALDDQENALKCYQEASLYKTTFYGQLASHKIGKLPFPAFHESPPVDQKIRHVFEKKELVQAIRLLAQTGPSGHPYIVKFLCTLAKYTSTPADKQLTVALAGEVHPHIAADIARSIKDTSGIVLTAAYPVLSPPPGTSREQQALLMAIIHRETRFNGAARGDAGERGLMQIMPETAAQEAKILGIPHNPQHLFDPHYNMKLASSYLTRHLSEFDGSYVLGIASYNAGKGAVLRWVNEMGNPHNGPFDVADWIERIPYASVRDYVQRVLENVTTYRARLGQKDVHLVHDLRGR